MKQCKAGPNLVMPNKTRYSRIAASEIPKIIDQHFPTAIREDLPTGIVPQYSESTLIST